MRSRVTYLGLTLVASAQAFCVPGRCADTTVIEINNQGIQELAKKDYVSAIKTLKRAVEYDPEYTLARDNLAIAYNNYGLNKRAEPLFALACFCSAMSIQPANATTGQNMSGIIKLLGKNPRSKIDRDALIDQLEKQGMHQEAIYFKGIDPSHYGLPTIDVYALTFSQDDKIC